jgi:hypothetical protein
VRTWSGLGLGLEFRFIVMVSVLGFRVMVSVLGFRYSFMGCEK